MLLEHKCCNLSVELVVFYQKRPRALEHRVRAVRALFGKQLRLLINLKGKPEHNLGALPQLGSKLHCAAQKFNQALRDSKPQPGARVHGACLRLLLLSECLKGMG